MFTVYKAYTYLFSLVKRTGREKLLLLSVSSENLGIFSDWPAWENVPMFGLILLLNLSHMPTPTSRQKVLLGRQNHELLQPLKQTALRSQWEIVICSWCSNCLQDVLVLWAFGILGNLTTTSNISNSRWKLPHNWFNKHRITAILMSIQN